MYLMQLIINDKVVAEKRVVYWHQYTEEAMRWKNMFPHGNVKFTKIGKYYPTQTQGSC